MKQTNLPNYAELSRVLNKTSLKLHPSQAHGIICGLLCGNPSSHDFWEKMITGDEKSRQVSQLLQDLYDSSAKQLIEFSFEFQLLLPIDTNELPERAEALTLWSQGFLTGLKFAQIEIVDREPSEATEAINDIIEIAKMNYEEVISSEEDEEAYIELVEYVRMAVILIYEDLHQREGSNENVSANKHLH